MGMTVAHSSSSNEDEVTPLELTINEYREKGYTILGPVQYLGKTPSTIILYRHKPVSYERLHIINESGYLSTVKKKDFVHVLKKDNSVVIIRKERKEVRDEI
jgi:hypothetical protein